MKKNFILVLVIILTLSFTNIFSDVKGKALLIDASNRTKPGNLLLCKINGKDKKMEVIVKGNVVDAHFSPDGKEVVYGLDKMIKIMNLKTRKSRDICPFVADLTYFNWCLDNKIYWSDGEGQREIFRVDIKTKKKEMVHKGNKGRSTISLDGKVAAWVLPPVCSFVGGKTYRYMGGCGGAVSPSGKYLTSNLTTSHKLMGVFSLGKNGPTKKPIANVIAPGKFRFNGFYFGRTDDWICYVLEHPKNVSPTSYICFWRTNEHIQISEFGKLCVKDFFDETNILPADAKLEKISVCVEGLSNSALTHVLTNVGVSKKLKVVGYYSNKDGDYTPEILEGVKWKVDTTKLQFNGSTYKGLAIAEKVKVTAEYKGKSASFDVTILPELKGNGFKAEFFSDATYTKKDLTRTDTYIDFRWTGRQSPDKVINGRKPWSAQWTGKLNVQVDGEYTFYFLQGEGNDAIMKGEGDKKVSCYSVWVDGKLMISRTKNWNIPWAKPKASIPLKLTKGMHKIKVTTIDRKTSQPMVCQLYWSGPGIKQSLLGGGYIHSK